MFGDKTLYDIVARRPTSDAALFEVWGMGRAKVERYGAELLRLQRETPQP